MLCLIARGHTTCGLSVLPNIYPIFQLISFMLIFWEDSWTGHDLSQITGHKLFLPVPMGAQEPSLDGQESQLYTPCVLPAAFWECLDFLGSRSK